jgi:hypothetical protein
MKAGILGLLVILSPLVASAQTFNICESVAIPVTIALTSEISSTVPSASIGIYAEMKNTGVEIISDAMLAVDVKEKSSGMIVDRFIVPQHITILPNSPAKASFVWKVPSEINSGKYILSATFVPTSGSRAEAFAHVYPTATNDIAVMDGALVLASIRSLRANGSAYEAHTVARVAEEGGVSAVAAAENGMPAPYKGSIVWKLYAPDAGLNDAPLDIREQQVGLHPGTTDNLDYSLPTLSLGSYYLEGKLSDGRGATYFDMLLARENGAFAWTQCIVPSLASGSHPANTTIVASVVIAIIALGLVLEFIERRRT